MVKERNTSTVRKKKPVTSTAMGIEIEDGKPIPLKARGRGFIFWIIGLFVSMAPLVVIHFGESLDDGVSLFLGLFGDVEIFFICVSMLVSASCEVISQRKNSDILNGLLLVCIVFFALLYSELNDATLTDEATLSIANVTLISLGITLLLGIIAYFSKER